MKIPQEYNNIQRNRENQILTTNQKKQALSLRQGVLVDNMINPHPVLNDLYDTMIISEGLENSKQICENCAIDTPKPKEINSLLAVCASSTGLFGIMGAVTLGLKKLAEYKAKTDPWLHLPEIARNVNLNNEKHFVTYNAIQNPNVKTAIGAAGVLVLASATFIAKNCIDGFKEIWVKRQEAKIQRDLQEKLINVETQSFAGKINVTRSLLSEYAEFFENTLQPNKKHSEYSPVFSKFIKFGKQEEKTENKDSNGLKTILLGSITALAMAGLTYLSLKNLQKTAKIIEKHKGDTIKTIRQSIEKMENVDQSQQENLKRIIAAIHPSKQDLQQILLTLKSKVGESEFSEIEKGLRTEIEKLAQLPPENFAGKASVKPSYFSYIDDYRGHFYNWLVNFDSPFLAALFLGIAGVSSGSYIGTRAIEAMKEVQVKKINAQTELDLQKQLVEVEVKNFENKKQAAIAPLVEEFRLQKENGKNNEELKNMATTILHEIKTGPPYIYS